MDFIYNEYLWAVGHFLLWLIIGRFIFKNWFLFFFISIGWEVFEYLLPYEIAKETLTNRLSDVLINFVGFYIGIQIRKRNKAQ
ncbi:MAG: hypothetical protein CL899_03370 [Dehalococcoidia bacterium]|nr:hypothetical protein [Dehalococcoidia bacterium]|tara:strand:+ start:240 stop:488 length:249 start_codon:yes stop_codon:yes gene_type:complete